MARMHLISRGKKFCRGKDGVVRIQEWSEIFATPVTVSVGIGHGGRSE